MMAVKLLRERASVRVMGTLTAILMMVGIVATSGSAAAAEAGSESPSPEVVDEQEYGPEDGLEVTTETFELVPGEGPVGVEYGETPPAPGEIAPLATWGASYAKSTEYAQLLYVGKAKAAANVYSGKRIIAVCIQYVQAGRSSSKVCSRATSSGSSWSAGAEKSVSFVDNLSDNWPRTVFTITTSRIDPQIF